MRDGADRIMRCLCGNNVAPVNGGCQDTVKRKLINPFHLKCALKSFPFGFLEGNEIL